MKTAKEISPKEEKHELHRLLGALLSETLREEEKLDILKNEYHIPMEKSIEEDVKVMCNLSDGIEERGKAEGIELARKVFKMKEQDASVQEIAKELQLSVEEVEQIIGE